MTASIAALLLSVVAASSTPEGRLIAAERRVNVAHRSRAVAAPEPPSARSRTGARVPSRAPRTHSLSSP
jgi:hypothetical protein